MKRLYTKKELEERNNSVIRDGKAFIETFTEVQTALVEMKFQHKKKPLTDVIALLNRLSFDSSAMSRNIDIINREEHTATMNFDNEFLIREVRNATKVK